MIYTDNENIIKEFKKLLIDNGIKQQYIADSLGLSKQSFNLKINKKHVTFDDLKEWLDCIGYELEFNFKKKE